MTKKELADIIREIVREEVKETLPTLMLEVLSEKAATSPARKASTSPVIREAVRTTVATESARPIKKFSNNPILNAVLNETRGGVPAENSVPMASTELSKSNTVVESLTAHIPQEVIAENKEVQAVVGALTRDYRSLIKAADAAAKKNFRP